MKTFEFKPLRGRETEILLENPDRGFRMETKMEVSGKEGLFSYDPYVFLDECLEKYKEDRPLITQHYFYLTNYKELLPQKGNKNIAAVCLYSSRR